MFHQSQTKVLCHGGSAAKWFKIVVNIKKHAPTTIEEYIYLDQDEVKQQEFSFTKRAKYAKLDRTEHKWTLE